MDAYNAAVEACKAKGGAKWRILGPCSGTKDGKKRQCVTCTVAKSESPATTKPPVLPAYGLRAILERHWQRLNTQVELARVREREAQGRLQDARRGKAGAKSPSEAAIWEEAIQQEIKNIQTERGTILTLEQTLSGIAKALASVRDQQTASATVVQGDVKVQLPGGGWEELAAFADLPVGANVRTGRGRAQVTFRDGSTVALEPDTIFIVERLTETESIYSITQGKLRAWIECLKRQLLEVPGECSYRYEAPNFAIGVRGTEFELTASEEGDAVAVFEGAVTVSPKNPPAMFDVKAGQQFFVGSDGGVRGPEPIPDAVLNKNSPER